MSLRKTLGTVLTLSVVMAMPWAAQAKSLWVDTSGQPRGARSWIADPVAREAGDIVTILISESTTAGNQADYATQQDTSGGLSAGQGLLSFIPFFSYGADDKYEFKGNQSWRGSFVTRMTAVVSEVTPQGLLKIEGTRTVDVNGERQEITLTGLVRPYDISPTNTIASEQIADAQIRYKGAGPMGQKAKPGLVTRLLDFLF